MFRSILLRAFLLTLLFSIFLGNANAVPLVLSHQGRLLDASDQPLSGTYTIIYSIHDAPVGGTQLWLEDHVGVVVSSGLFSVELGSTVPLPSDIFDGSGGGGGGGAIRYLQVQIAGQPPISPRTPLLSVPSAMVSGGVYGETTSGAERARGIVGKKPGGGATGYMIVLDADSDGDTVPESEISQSVTPTTSNVAIKTKGTGADANRVIGGTDDTTATMLMATDSASISMKVRKGGVIKGSIIINNGSALRMVEMGSDGNSYFASGVGIGVDPTHKISVAGGAYCDGTNWVNASDRNSKENFEQVDGGEILEKISDLEITKWNYKGDDDAQHIGPTAQDFKRTFGVGADDKSISTIDPSGIALAAIKELYVQLSELQKRDKEQSAKLQQRDAQLETLQSELKKLKDEMKKNK